MADGHLRDDAPRQRDGADSLDPDHQVFVSTGARTTGVVRKNLVVSPEPGIGANEDPLLHRLERARVPVGRHLVRWMLDRCLAGQLTAESTCCRGSDTGSRNGEVDRTTTDLAHLAEVFEVVQQLEAWGQLELLG